VLGIILLFIFEKDRANQALKDFLEWIKDHPVQGPFFLTLLYVLCTIFFVPGSVLTIGAGVAFKQAYVSTWKALLVGLVSVWIGASLGATVAFFLSRYVFSDFFQKFSKKYPIMDAINRAIHKEGLKLMLLLRLCPVLPFNAMNYLMGITSVEAKDYIFGCVGMIPGTLVYVFVGTTISDIADTAKGKSENNTLILVFLIVGSIIGCGGIIYISMVAKRMLNEKL